MPVTPRLTGAFAQRIYAVERQGRDPTTAACGLSAADIELALTILRFETELQNVRDALERHPLTTTTTATTTKPEDNTTRVEARRAFVARFAGGETRADALEAELEMRLHRR
jgi:hypothetical protein